MRSFAFVFLIACGGGTKTPSSAPSNQPEPASGSGSAMVAAPAARPTCVEANVKCVIDSFNGFSQQMCACKDKACAEKVNTDVTAWGEEMSKRADNSQKPTDEETKAVMEVVTKYTDCMTKVMIDAQPPSDPCGGDPCGGS